MNQFFDKVDEYMVSKFSLCVPVRAQKKFISRKYIVSRNPSAYWDNEEDIPFVLKLSTYEGIKNHVYLIFENLDDTSSKQRVFLLNISTGEYEDATEKIQSKIYWGTPHKKYLEIIKDVRFLGTNNAVKFIFD